MVNVNSTLSDLQHRSHFHSGRLFSPFIVFVTITSLLLGLLLSAYFQFIVKKEAPQSFSLAESGKIKRLNRILRKVEDKNEDLKADLFVWQHKIHQLTGERVVSLLSNYTGEKVLFGEGLEITIQDSSKPLQLGDNPSLGIIHNTDLLALVNQLWTFGAKGIAINNQRIQAMTEITCAGPIILINRSRVASPFVIQVVGPAETLQQKLNGRESYLKYLASYGITARIQAGKVLLPPAIAD